MEFGGDTGKTGRACGEIVDDFLGELLREFERIFLDKTSLTRHNVRTLSVGDLWSPAFGRDKGSGRVVAIPAHIFGYCLNSPI